MKHDTHIFLATEAIEQLAVRLRSRTSGSFGAIMELRGASPCGRRRA